MTEHEQPATHEALMEQLRTAALADAQQWHKTGDTGNQLHKFLPADVMPSEELLQAVYAITGASGEHRRMRARKTFRMTAETESAWSRAALKRWAAHRLSEEQKL